MKIALNRQDAKDAKKILEAKGLKLAGHRGDRKAAVDYAWRH